MITLIPNADKEIGKLAYSDGVRAYYYSVCERYAKGYVQTFITDMQNLITKLGILISTVSTRQKNISYCAQSIEYLCNTVLDKPNLEKSFNELGLNTKGNIGKHKIVTNTMNLDKCVVVYNSLVDLISTTYNLPTLKKAMIVRKIASTEQSAQPKAVQPVQPKNPQPAQPKKSQPKNPQPAPKKSQPAQPKNAQPSDVVTRSDERIKLKAEIKRGDGKYELWMIRKKQMFHFIIDINITNPDNLKISDVTAYITGYGNNNFEQKLSTEEQSSNEINMEMLNNSGNVVAQIIVKYKLGLVRTKKITLTVSKNFG